MPAEHCLHLRACPRCHGDIADTSDMYGSFQHCLACGKVIYPQQAETLPLTLADAWRDRVKNGRPKKKVEVA